MSFQNFRKIIDENHPLIRSLSLYNYGEPFLNSNLPEMIYYAKKKGICYVKVATNGMHLTGPKIIRSGLDYLSISLDGATEETYEKFRTGGRFQKVVSNTRHLVKERDSVGSKLKIEIQFIIMRHNEHEIQAIEELARSLNVDFLRLKTVLVKKDRWRYLLPANARYTRYRQKKASTRCLKPLNEMVINCDGMVIPCCYIVEKDIKKFKMGNAFQQPLQDILDSQKYQEFIRKCTTQKSGLSSCKNCNEGNLPMDYQTIKTRSF